MATNRKFSLRFLLIFVAIACMGVYAYTNRIHIANTIFYRDKCVARILASNTNKADTIVIRVNNNSDQEHEIIYRDTNSGLRFAIKPKQESNLKIIQESSGILQIFWNGNLEFQKILPQDTHLSYGYGPSPKMIESQLVPSYFNGRPHQAQTLVYEFWIDLK